MNTVKRRLLAIEGHPTYLISDEFREEVAITQRAKGAEKYDELFDPNSHTDDELANHAMMEFHDGQEYVSGMRTRMRQLRAIIKHQEQVIAKLQNEKGNN